jgi:hypothetical protein
MNMLNLPMAILWLALGIVRIDGTSPSMIHAFGGQPVKVELAIETPGGNAVEVRADLYQKGQSLLAPIQKDIAVAKAAHSEESPAFRPLVSWTLPVPEVKRETQMMARFRVTTDGTTWTPAGQILITAYPAGFAKQELAAFGKTPGLHVFGGGKQLRGFLQTQKVEFDDAGEGLSALPQSPDDPGIYIGDATSRELADWLGTHPGWRGNLVVFCSDSALLPGVFVTAQGGFRTIKVTLLLLDTLSGDPRSQKTLLEILTTITTP